MQNTMLFYQKWKIKKTANLAVFLFDFFAVKSYNRFKYIGGGIVTKLYFKYGAMGSSKTAQALMCKFNYEQKGFDVLLLKPAIDTRDKSATGETIVSSRIGLTSKCLTVNKDENLYDLVNSKTGMKDKTVVIVDECQFLTKKQVDELKEVSTHMPVLCYGLLTNFKTELFEGSKRLVELAESLMEIKSVCACGKKATINARLVDGELAIDGEEVLLGKEESYKAVCYKCYTDLKKSVKK